MASKVSMVTFLETLSRGSHVKNGGNEYNEGKVNPLEQVNGCTVNLCVAANSLVELGLASMLVVAMPK